MEECLSSIIVVRQSQIFGATQGSSITDGVGETSTLKKAVAEVDHRVLVIWIRVARISQRCWFRFFSWIGWVRLTWILVRPILTTLEWIVAAHMKRMQKKIFVGIYYSSDISKDCLYLRLLWLI